MNERKIIVRTLRDLKEAIIPFTIGHFKARVSDVPIKANVEYLDEGGNKRIETVSAITRDITLRRLLIEGFDLVKKRLQLAKDMKDKYEEVHEDDDLLPERIKWNLFDIDTQFLHVDTLIKQELDGKRKGLRIRWDISEGIYEFDPYECKLYRIEDD